VPFHVRKATPTDVPFLSWVVLAASRSHLARGAFYLLVPESEPERRQFLSALLQARPSWCHHAVFRIAEVRGEAAAALAAYPVSGGDLSPPEEILPEVARAEGWSEARLSAAFGAMAPFLGCVPREDPEAWAVEWVATDPDFRRRGLVTGLLDQVLEDGRRHGHRVAQLLILLGNTPAQRAYEKVGFRIVDERRTPEFEAALGCPGLARMEAPL